MSRYYPIPASSSPPAPPVGARFNGYTIVSSTATDETLTQSVIGDASALVNMQVSSYVSNFHNSLFEINGLTKPLGSTFNITLNGSGLATFTVYVKGGISRGDYINVQIEITSSSGVNGVGSPSTQQYSKIV